MGITTEQLSQLQSVAELLSKSSLMPKPLQGKPADVFAIILKGAELGIEPMQAVGGISIIQGKASLGADLIAGLVMRKTEICEYLTLTESTPTKVVYKAKRKGGEEVTMVFTMEMAKRAGLVNPMYSKFPEAMLKARCITQICRAVFPDLAAGLYDSDTGELTDGKPVVVPAISKIDSNITASPTPEAQLAPVTGTMVAQSATPDYSKLIAGAVNTKQLLELKKTLPKKLAETLAPALRAKYSELVNAPDTKVQP